MHNHTASCILHCKDHAEYVDICLMLYTLSDAVYACNTEVAYGFTWLHGSRRKAGTQRLGSTEDAMIEQEQHSTGFWPQKQPDSHEKLQM